jgi:hypothetical protein
MKTEMSEQEQLTEEQAEIKAQTDAQMLRAKLNDYIAIILALGTVFILWLLQAMGLY